MTERSGPGMSYIDHVSLTQTLVADMNSCGVIPDDIRNISDHLPIYLIIMTHGITRRQATEQVYRQVAWNRLDEDDIKYLYTLPLEQEIKQVLGRNGVDPEYVLNEQAAHQYNTDVDSIVREITQAILKCHSKLPQRSVNKKLKPFWSKTLSCMSRESKNAWKQWVNVWKPDDPCNEYYIRGEKAI